MDARKLTLPARYYVDNEFFQRELEYLYMGSWLCAGRADQISAPGEYFLREVGKESVIFVRGEDHKVRALFNVCRHRGTRLCAESAGVFTGRIQCPYHAWTYSLSGQLVGAPLMADASGFCTEDHPLAEARCEEWDGHLFVSLAGEPRMTLSSHLGPLVDKFKAWRMQDLRLGHRVVYEVKANWKLIVQNYSECVHCPVIHPLLQKLSHFMSGENEPSRPTHLGGRMLLKEGVETLTMDGKRRREVLPGLPIEERNSVHYYWIAPNFLLSLHPDYMLTHTLWPQAPGLTSVVCEWHFHRDEIGKPGFVAHDAVEFWDVTNRQDWYVSELSQLGIASRAYTPGPYSNREGLLYDFDRIIESSAQAGGY